MKAKTTNYVPEKFMDKVERIYPPKIPSITGKPMPLQPKEAKDIQDKTRELYELMRESTVIHGKMMSVFSELSTLRSRIHFGDMRDEVNRDVTDVYYILKDYKIPIGNLCRLCAKMMQSGYLLNRKKKGEA